MSLGLKGLRNTTAECTKQTHRKVKEGNTKHTESQRGTKQNKTKQNTQKVTEGQHKTYSNTQKVKGTTQNTESYRRPCNTKHVQTHRNLKGRRCIINMRWFAKYL